MPSVGSFQHPSPRVPPQRINALHVPQMRRDGAAPGVIAPHGRRRDSVQIKFAGAPTPLPGLHSGVRHWSVIHTFVGSPRSPSGIPVVARPVSHSRNFRRSASGGTSPDRSSGGRHARHRPDEGVRQSRPGHPGVGRFGSWFPRRSPDPEDRAADAAFPRRPDGDTVGGRQPPRTEFHAFSLAQT